MASSVDRVIMRMDTMTPYNPNTSAKMRIRTIPTYSRGCCELARTGQELALAHAFFMETASRHTSRIANNANCKTGSQPAQANRQASPELQKPSISGHLLLQVTRYDDARDEAVDGEDLGHDGAEAEEPKPLVSVIPRRSNDLLFERDRAEVLTYSA